MIDTLNVLSTNFPVLLLSYCIGAIPFGLIITQFFLGYDVRTKGSGNIGMTNVMRTGGKWPGIATFLLDFGKGAVVPALALYYFKAEELVVLVSAFLAVFGHTRSIFLKFTGGKGVATNFGVLLILDWKIGVSVAAVWVGMFLWKKISSLSALTALCAFPGITFIFAGLTSLFYLSVVLSFYIIALHHENIKRLINSEEGKLKSSK